jgi:tetratricopeptide (TPR) repeat protein
MPTMYEARLRHARHYAQRSRAIDELYAEEGMPRLKVAEKLYSTEKSQIDRGWLWARQQPYTNIIDELLIDYIGATVYAMHLQGDIRGEQIPTLERTLDAANRLVKKAEASVLAGRLGAEYARLREFQRAIPYYEYAIALSQELGNLADEGYHTLNMKLTCTVWGETQRRIECLKKLISIVGELGHRKSQAHYCWELGGIYEQQGDILHATELMQMSVNILSEIGNPEADKRSAHLQRLCQFIATSEAQK